MIIMFTVRFNASIPRSRLNMIATGISAAHPEIMQACGVKLMGLARIYFDNLSRGGAGYSGRRWKPPSPATVKRRKLLAQRGLLRAPAAIQGIVTGEMQQSLKMFATTRTVSLYYDTPYAKFFNAHRRLIPTTLPRVWRYACDQIVDQTLQAHLKGL